MGKIFISKGIKSNMLCQPRHLLSIFLIFTNFQPILLIKKKKCSLAQIVRSHPKRFFTQQILVSNLFRDTIIFFNLKISGTTFFLQTKQMFLPTYSGCLYLFGTQNSYSTINEVKTY